MHQISEQPVFMACQLDRIAIDRNAASSGVETHWTAIKFTLGVARRPAQKRAYTREHFFKMEWLGDIIVGAGIETLDLVAPSIASGQHQHRHCPSCPAPGFQDRDAVHLRQADIENDGVVGFGLSEIVSLFAVESTIDDITGVSQRGSELSVEVRIILDDEEAQGIFSA